VSDPLAKHVETVKRSQIDHPGLEPDPRQHTLVLAQHRLTDRGPEDARPGFSVRPAKSLGRQARRPQLYGERLFDVPPH
jgi:hypothetical protein